MLKINKAESSLTFLFLWKLSLTNSKWATIWMIYLSTICRSDNLCMWSCRWRRPVLVAFLHFCSADCLDWSGWVASKYSQYCHAAAQIRNRVQAVLFISFTLFQNNAKHVQWSLGHPLHGGPAGDLVQPDPLLPHNITSNTQSCPSFVLWVMVSAMLLSLSVSSWPSP